MQVLTDSLKMDRHQVLACIKYEVLGKRPVYDSYKTFCERMGDAFMKYQEFEFWYMRFYNGEMDMDYDRSKDPKPKELLQLPVEIVGIVVEKFDLPGRLITRNVCKPLRTIVDGCKMKFKLVHLYQSAMNFPISLDFGNERIRYDLNPDKGGITIDYGERKFQKKGVDLVNIAMNDLNAIMKGHNLKLDNLYIQNEHENSSLVEKALECLKHISDFSKTQLKVKTFTIRCVNTNLIVPFLTLLKPRILKDITVYHLSDEISNTEQWQQAKIGRFFNAENRVNPMNLIKQFSHFEEFWVNVNSMSADVMVQLREMLLTSPSFKKCVIKIFSNPKFTIHMISTALGLPIQNEEVHVPIPDSTDVFLIEVFGVCIKIERRSL